MIVFKSVISVTNHGRSLERKYLPGTEDLIVSSHGRVGYPKLGCLSSDGYRRIQYKRKRHYVHRLICYAFHYRFEVDKRIVDHIDQNKQNNHASNLRFYTHQMNGYNSNKSKGYHHINETKPWQGQICVKGKRHSKAFDTEEEAQTWYLRMKASVVANGGVWAC